MWRVKAEKVSELSFEADIGDQPFEGVRLKSGHVARIRIAVGVRFFTIEQEHKFVALGNRVGNLLARRQSDQIVMKFRFGAHDIFNSG